MGWARVNLAFLGLKEMLNIFPARQGSGETFRHSQTAELQLQELAAQLMAAS